MPRLTLVTLILASAPGAWAQSPFIYQVKAFDCGQVSPAHDQTAFRLIGTPGLVTALHGVIGCGQINVTSDSNVAYTNLTISEVDIDHDAAIITNDQFADTTQGVAPAANIDWAALANVNVVGHPLGIDEKNTQIVVGNPPIVQLFHLVTDDIANKMSARGSPSKLVSVLSLQQGLLPGYSGAPVLDQAGNVVAFGDGGLLGGSAGINWAMPLADLAWLPSQSEGRLSAVAAKDPTDLFYFSTDSGDPAGTLSIVANCQVQVRLNGGKPILMNNGDIQSVTVPSGDVMALVEIPSIGYRAPQTLNVAQGAVMTLTLDLGDELARRLTIAVRAGNVGDVKNLLNIGASATADAGDNGHSAFTLAATLGRSDVVQAMLDDHADPDSTDKSNCTALAWALSKGQADVVHKLVLGGANVSKVCNDSTPLVTAASQGYGSIAVDLYKGGADLTNGTVLSDIFSRGSASAIGALADAGAFNNVQKGYFYDICLNRSDVCHALITSQLINSDSPEICNEWKDAFIDHDLSGLQKLKDGGIECSTLSRQLRDQSLSDYKTSVTKLQDLLASIVNQKVGTTPETYSVAEAKRCVLNLTDHSFEDDVYSIPLSKVNDFSAIVGDDGTNSAVIQDAAKRITETSPDSDSGQLVTKQTEYVFVSTDSINQAQDISAQMTNLGTACSYFGNPFYNPDL